MALWASIKLLVMKLMVLNDSTARTVVQKFSGTVETMKNLQEGLIALKDALTSEKILDIAFDTSRILKGVNKLGS